MKYTPRELADNVNVSHNHPLAELAWLVGGLVVIVAIISLGFWWLAELVVPRVPVDVEVWAGKQLLEKYRYQENPDLTKLLHTLLQTLPPKSPLRTYDFSVHVADNEAVNAMALPGGQIMVFSGLLKQVRSENELAMVLGHELGHYAHRDHLRGLGRGLGVTLALAMFFGQDSALAGLASDLFLGMEMSYSRQQETAADAFGLDMLVAGYGHAGGATDFFSRLAGQAGGTFPYLLASHPHPGDRIVVLRKMIAQKGYPLGNTVPWKISKPSGNK
ncbi:MAG: M48 family metallopeptidase [Geobacteraceae bacterium]|nr:M48 family metallopeptidase [Geobacteraceae bacterium]